MEFYLSNKVATWPAREGRRDFKVHENAYFVMGDNRLWSADSRSYGSINKSQVVGRLGR